MESFCSLLQERTIFAILLVLYGLLIYTSYICFTFCVSAMNRLIRETVLNIRTLYQNLDATCYRTTDMIEPADVLNKDALLLVDSGLRHPTVAISSGCIALNRSPNNTLKMETVGRNETIIAPDECVKRQIVNIIKNLSQRNLQTKCEEFKDIITGDYLPWVSNYMVMKLIGPTSDNHLLYLNFLDCLKNKSLNLLIKSDTINNINGLLKRDKRKFNYYSETILSNLGHWIGMITIGKNKPVTTYFGEFETLLEKAYYRGDKDIYNIVLFIENVMESCANSKDYNTKNPWTIKILNLLAEIYKRVDLDLYLKFKIEYLCKSLNIQLQDLKPECMLRRKKNDKVQSTSKAKYLSQNIYYFA